MSIDCEQFRYGPDDDKYCPDSNYDFNYNTNRFNCCCTIIIAIGATFPNGDPCEGLCGIEWDPIECALYAVGPCSNENILVTAILDIFPYGTFLANNCCPWNESGLEQTKILINDQESPALVCDGEKIEISLENCGNPDDTKHCASWCQAVPLLSLSSNSTQLENGKIRFEFKRQTLFNKLKYKFKKYINDKKEARKNKIFEEQINNFVPFEENLININNKKWTKSIKNNYYYDKNNKFRFNAPLCNGTILKTNLDGFKNLWKNLSKTEHSAFPELSLTKEDIEIIPEEFLASIPDAAFNKLSSEVKTVLYNKISKYKIKLL